MTTSILPDLAAGSATALSRAVGRGLDDDTPPAVMDGIIAHVRHVTEQMKRVRDGFASWLDQGVEAAHFRSACGLVVESLDAFQRSLTSVSGFLQTRPRSAERSNWLEALGECRTENEGIRRTLAEWLDAAKPPAADFWEKAGAAAAQAGPFVPVEKYEEFFGDEPGPF